MPWNKDDSHPQAEPHPAAEESPALVGQPACSVPHLPATVQAIQQANRLLDRLEQVRRRQQQPAAHPVQPVQQQATRAAASITGDADNTATSERNAVAMRFFMEVLLS